MELVAKLVEILEVIWHIYCFADVYMQVNHIAKGINPSSVNQIYFSGEYLLQGVKIGVVAGMIALTVRLCHNV